MDFDQLMLMLLICGAAYFAGHATIAIGLLIITGLVFLAGGTKQKKQYYPVPGGGVQVRGAEMLEPIIVETSRGPPFRIPAKMDMRVNPTWSALTLVEKATYKGAGAVGKLIHGAIFGRDWE